MIKKAIKQNLEEVKIEPEFKERTIEINRVVRVVKGGRRFRFRALVIVGDGAGQVGFGLGKASEVSEAISKAVKVAKKNLICVPIKNDTIPYSIEMTFGGAKVLLKPASPGTGIIAGGSVRAVIELVGIKNILSKILGSSNKVNNARAAFLALKSLQEDDLKQV